MNAFAKLVVLSALPLWAGCGPLGGTQNEAEVFTTVSLTFTPVGGGAAVTAAFKDPDGDGGNAPTIDPITLVAGTQYTTTVTLLNELETPAVDITLEVKDESDQHQLFFTGTAVNGPASNQPTAPLTHVYGDTDVNGLPVGLVNNVAAKAGTGMLTLTLRHMPPVNGAAVKVAGLADTVKASGFAAIGGETDVSVNFVVTVP